MKSISSSRLVPVLIAGTLFCASLFVWRLFPALYEPSRLVEPYLTVTTTLPHETAVARLEAAGVDQIISPANTYVLLSRISRVDQVPISELDELLDPLDPRLDPFMRQLSSYFAIDGRNALFVAVPGVPFETWRVARAALGPDARVAEFDPASGLLAASLPLFAAIAGLMISRRSAVLRLISVAPLLLPAFAYGLGAGVAAALVGLAVDWLAVTVRLQRALRDGELPGALARHRLRVVWAAVVIILGLTYAGLVRSPLLVGALALAIAGNVALRVGAGILRRRVVRDEEHPVFRPVPILDEPRLRSVSQRERAIALAAIVIIGATALIGDRLGSAGSDLRPVARSTVPGPAFESLALVAHEDLPDSLPGIADYLAHRAYQEGFAYGGEYEFPNRDKPVVLERFRLGEDGVFSSYSEDVLRFDQAWLDAAFADTPPGIVSLLASRRALSGVALARREALYSRYSRIVLHVLFLIVASIPFAAGPPSRVRLMDKAGVLVATGRSRQVA